jgi:pyruvate formate lyase activating enzyme
MNAPRGRIFNLQRFSLHDGPGIRTTVFFKGCPLDCAWCHNPESRSPEVSGAAGREVSVDEVLSAAERDRPFYETSGGGVTFSGGEPLAQPEFLLACLLACRAEGLPTALDTCGFAPEGVLLAAAALSDVVLYDLKALDDRVHVQATGVSNVSILENLEALARSGASIWLRMPIVPTVNDGALDMVRAAALARDLPGVERVCLLPYHALGVDKALRLGQKPRFGPVASPSQETLDALAAPFREAGLAVQIGG